MLSSDEFFKIQTGRCDRRTRSVWDEGLRKLQARVQTWFNRRTLRGHRLRVERSNGDLMFARCANCGQGTSVNIFNYGRHAMDPGECDAENIARALSRNADADFTDCEETIVNGVMNA